MSELDVPENCPNCGFRDWVTSAPLILLLLGRHIGDQEDVPQHVDTDKLTSVAMYKCRKCGFIELFSKPIRKRIQRE